MHNQGVRPNSLSHEARALFDHLLMQMNGIGIRETHKAELILNAKTKETVLIEKSSDGKSRFDLYA